MITAVLAAMFAIPAARLGDDLTRPMLAWPTFARARLACAMFAVTIAVGAMRT